jgi:methionyl-tRNA formyltransferase
MENVKILFFGTTDDSVLVLDKLFNFHLPTSIIQLQVIVTQPPRPVGRNHDITPTPVNLWADTHQITCLSFNADPEKPWLYENESDVTRKINANDFDLIISACYGQKIPESVIRKAKYGGINIHPSVLPLWRGADPVPWTIISGDSKTGVTLVTISDKFDQGKIINQELLDIREEINSDLIRTKLFDLGARLLIKALPRFLSGEMPGVPQDPDKSTYSRKVNREDGFIPWDTIQNAVNGKTVQESPEIKNLPVFVSLAKYNITPNDFTPLAEVIRRMFIGLSPWPGIWTLFNNRNQVSGIMKHELRLKIVLLHMDDQTNNLVLDQVQLEGKNPVSFKQFKEAYL